MNASPDSAVLPSAPALDPCLLGRPIHLLDTFALQFRDDLRDLLQVRLNRRHRASFEVGAVAMRRADAAAGPDHWLLHGSPAGRIGFAIERELLLCALDYRYGVGAPTAPEAVRKTSTEERLAAKLGRTFTAALAARIAALPCAPEDSAELPCEPCDTTPGTNPTTWWMLSAEVVEASRGVRGAMRFALDEAVMHRLLRGLAPPRKARAAGGHEPLQRRLQLDLVARLLDKQFPLGTVIALRVGDVIPIRLGPADVIVGDSALFRATVAEHRGKLCLTSFEDLE